MSFDAANAQRTREGAHYHPTRAHAADWVRPSRAKQQDSVDGLRQSIDRGYRRVARKYGWEPAKF